MIRGRYNPGAKVAKGTAEGQMLYWDGTKWVQSDESYLKWDADNREHTVETLVVKRVLAGGVQP